MADGEESKNDSAFLSGLSRKRTYRDIQKSISGSLKKITKKPKLDETCSTKSNETIFRYGNYNRYYGYRNENRQEDKRLTVFKKEWFENKSVLDIGSNVGHVSLWIGKHFHPEKIKGVDIDLELVKVAKKNIVHYIDENYVSNLEDSFSNNETSKTNNTVASEDVPSDSKESKTSAEVPDIVRTDTGTEVLCESSKEHLKSDNMSPIDETFNNDTGNVLPTEEEHESKSFVPTDKKPQGEVLDYKKENESKAVLPLSEKKNEDNESANVMEEIAVEDEEEMECKAKNVGKQLMERLEKSRSSRTGNVFPYNVSFVLENYVPPGAAVLKYVKEEYHVILCLSVTKWVQLNFGDLGVKMMFQKIYKQLHPGGLFILEAQPYKSYKRRKNLTPAIRRNYDSMEFMPDQFIEYLLSSEVGFSRSEQIGDNLHEKQGFQRPIYLLTKD